MGHSAEDLLGIGFVVALAFLALQAGLLGIGEQAAEQGAQRALAVAGAEEGDAGTAAAAADGVLGNFEHTISVDRGQTETSVTIVVQVPTIWLLPAQAPTRTVTMSAPTERFEDPE